MSNVKELLAVAASFCTLLQFLSGGLICRQYVRQKDVGEDSHLPFIAGFLNCSIWLSYGMVSQEFTIIFVNAVGLVLFFSYATTHYIYSIQRNLVIRDFLICIVLIGLMNIYILTGIRREILQYHIGNLASFITVLFFAAPLTNMVTVIKTGNVSSLPLPFISMTLVATFLWFLYGLVVDDIYVQLPNAIGLVLGVAQLSVYFLYRSRNPIKMSRLKVPLNEYEL
nr:PREDICTED: sugar transporter SWEET1-like [Bemisia tabaci]XP_018907894.1 PREDICTED: sugar transporter SWEET1-like [Bemisia tabaci]